jgi:hypothetical protein
VVLNVEHAENQRIRRQLRWEQSRDAVDGVLDLYALAGLAPDTQNKIHVSSAFRMVRAYITGSVKRPSYLPEIMSLFAGCWVRQGKLGM